MYVTDVPVMDRMTSRERYELESAYWEFYQAHEEALNALEDVSAALVKEGWKAEGADAPANRLADTVNRLDFALSLNGFDV